MKREVLAAVAGFLVLVLTGNVAFADPSDGAILRELRPEQRQFVILAERDGAPRVIAYTPLAARPEIAASPRRRRPTLVAARPHASAHLKANPILVAVRDGRAFIPTATTAKPIAHSSPDPEIRDLAWIYNHRFDSPPSDSVHIPGDLVRSQLRSPFDVNSGAFHGVRAVNGWSAVRVVVSIPCGARHFATGWGYNERTGRMGIVDQETGYITVGGWGAGPSGAAADAGLQKSSAQAEGDDYAVYWKYARNKPITSTLRFPCGGPDVVMEFYPVSEHLLVFSATGLIAGRRVTLTVVQRTRAEDGWLPNGGSAKDGIILKRTLAIAQPASWHRPWSFIFGGNHLTDGSYFGVGGPNDSTPRIVWRSCELGRVAPPAIVPRYQSWTPLETWHPSAPGVYTNWPPADVVSGSNGSCDAAGIYLRGA